MSDAAQTPSSELPDRLSIDPRSPHHRPEVFERDVGITFNGKERFDVAEYCISEGWVKVPAGRTLDRKVEQRPPVPDIPLCPKCLMRGRRFQPAPRRIHPLFHGLPVPRPGRGVQLFKISGTCHLSQLVGRRGLRETAGKSDKSGA